MNLAVLMAIGTVRLTGYEWIDPAAALAIASYMLWNSRHIAVNALWQLLNRELPPEYRDRIRTTVLGCRDVYGLHDLRTRYSGDRIFVDFHLEVDSGLTVARGHDVCSAVGAKVAKLFQVAVDVTTHAEPAGIEDARLDVRHGPTPTPGR